MPSDMKNQNPVIDAVIKAVMGAVTETAAKRDNNLSVPAVREAKPELIEAMTKAVAADPKVQFSTNTEPWYTKRSRWSAIIGPVSMLVGVGLKLAGVDYSFGLVEQGLLADALVAIGTLIAGYLALRAGIATRPIGPNSLP